MRKKLHILGGPPIVGTPLFIKRPFLPKPEVLHRHIDALYASRILTNSGPTSSTLEAELSRRLNVKHVVAVSSATMGLQLLFNALNLNGDVILPSFTFVASAYALSWEGLTPVFADIEPNFFTLDVDHVESLITSRTSAIMGVHLFGNPCDINALAKLAHKHNLPLIFDAAQALGSCYQGKPIGSFGEAEVFSLHATKIINSLEGGFISTNNSALYEKLILMRNFGFTGYDQSQSLGINGKMNELAAAVALESLPELDGIIAKNISCHDAYRDLLKNIPGISVFRVREDCSINGNIFPILVGPEFGLSRDQLCDIFWKENILTRRYVYPGCHRQSYYKKAFPSLHLPVTDAIGELILCLPCHIDLSEEIVKRVADTILESHDRRDELRNYYLHHPIDAQINSFNP